jgi:hypothetical protein
MKPDPNGASDDTVRIKTSFARQNNTWHLTMYQPRGDGQPADASSRALPEPPKL